VGRLRPEEISSILKGAITDYENRARTEEVGQVLQVGDGIAQVHGLANVMYQEMVEFEDDRGETIYGLAMSLEEDSVGVIIMGNDRWIREGSTVRRTERVMRVPVGNSVLGRVINPIGDPMDDKGQIEAEETRPVEVVAPGVMRRQDVDTPVHTGIKAIDAMVPIGRGQRELILGDRKLGKTTLAVDTIINQHDQNLKCIYVAIAQKDATVAGVVNTLEEHGALDYTVVVNAPAHEEATFHYLAPYAGCAIGEYFMDQGEDALIIYDDLSKHANAYRQLMLLLRRPPGREAFPGDIFYLHSRLLERAARMADEYGGGSLTAIPIGETKGGDISAFIPTNLISITDGQIFLDSDMFNSGQRPPIDVGNSVSRVGGDAQIEAVEDVTGTLRLDLAQYFELQSFAQFGSDLDQATQETLARGERTMNMLQQGEHQPMPIEDQVVVIYAVTSGMVDDIDPDSIPDWEGQFLEHMKNSHEEILNNIRETQEFSDEDEENLTEIIQNFNENYEPGSTGTVQIGAEAEQAEEDEEEDDEEEEEG
jgi:F-type H+/Na+-transporting ATPase subunit alpha